MDPWAAIARVFRVYKPTPPHYHATCDDPKDIVFVNPEDGTPESFIRAAQ
jgi:hypothetical protein